MASFHSMRQLFCFLLKALIINCKNNSKPWKIPLTNPFRAGLGRGRGLNRLRFAHCEERAAF